MSLNSEMNHINASRSNTLNRRNSNLMSMNHNIIPPPDVTHTTKMMPIMVSGTGTMYGGNSHMSVGKPNNCPPGILKDPKRNQQNQLNSVNKDLQMQSILMPMPPLVMNDGNAHHLSAAQLMNNFDATNANLANFNHQMGFPETDGHLV
jgi:hypothetical protein